MYHRRRKGLSTLCLVLCAESIAFSDAVTFWNHYNAWSARNNQHHQQQEDTFEPSFSKAAKQAQECAILSTDDSSSSMSCRGKRTTPPPVRLFPRERLRFQSAIKTGDYCRVCESRCRNEGAVNNLLVRGGHGSSSTVLLEAAAGAAADVARDALQVATTKLPLGIPLNGWKVIFQFFLTLMNVVCWLIPLKSKKISENKVALSLANSFSGGVFLSLAFGHLLPECAHGFNGMNEATPFMLALVGYMLIFFVEKVAFDTDSILHHDGHSHGKVEQNGDSPPLLANGRGAVILLGALAVHSILEMMALGLADTFGDSALLSLSIALHQVSA
jgi:zinc transporter ZupT